MATEKGRAYYVSISVELAPGEERQADEYGYGESVRVVVYDWGVPEQEYLAVRAAKAVRTGLEKAQDQQRWYVKNQSWWRRLFKHDD